MVSYLLCSKCGTKVLNPASFCTECGQQLDQSVYEATPKVQPTDLCFGEKPKERDMMGLMSFGVFLVIVGLIYVTTPKLDVEIVAFFRSFNLVQIMPNIYLPTPSETFPILYFAIAKFCVIFGIFQIIILILEFVIKASINKRAETISGIVFWLGAGYLAYQLSIGSIVWSQNISMLIVLIGVAIVLRGLVHITFKKMFKTEA